MAAGRWRAFAALGFRLECRMSVMECVGVRVFKGREVDSYELVAMEQVETSEGG